MQKINTWHEAYVHIAELLNEFYIKYKSNAPVKIYEKLEISEFAKINNAGLFNPGLNLNEKGLDPIQIFSTFNYSRIKDNIRLKNLEALLEVLGSNKKINKGIRFVGIPAPIIAKVILYRGLPIQRKVWRNFHEIVTKGIQGLTENDFKYIQNWRGIDIPSYTMFLFWINSDQFLPLDQNTVNFLKGYNLISDRPKNFKQYNSLCTEKINLEKYKDGKHKDLFRTIVKDAYNFSDRKYQGDILSGSTITVISNLVEQQSVSQHKLQENAQLKRNELFKSFKIIGLRPKRKEEQEENKDFQNHLKNLQVGRLYQFYGAYKFNKKDDIIIEYSKNEDIEIYNSDDLNISISAIVGKNGSGKSTLVEFLYLIINKISFLKKIKSTEKLINEDVCADLFIKSDKLYKISVENKIEIFEYEFNEERSSYQQIENSIDFNQFDIEKFCYSIVVNYSLYGLNSKIIGEWINPLFHKNDSYQVPIVLTPQRIEGNINVNIEDELAKSRLLSSILEPNLIDFKNKIVPELIPNLIPNELTFELNNEKFERKRKKYNQLNGGDINVIQINKVISSLKINIHDSIDYVEEAKEYIYLKLISIAYNYPTKFKDYQDLPIWIDDKVKLQAYIKILSDETSHITFKLRQAINYLEFGIYSILQNNSILELAGKIKNIQLGNTSNEVRTIDLLPPSFFKINVKFKHGGTFNNLSSGEKQQIFSINTIAYHLYNIKSVMIYEEVYKYSSVNIIFDEVELYFHPDMQRTFINNLRNRIISMCLNKENDINNINIIFVTHSPFILSDIPKSNVLMLELDKNGKSRPIETIKNTFGANIHELLTESFFLSSSIGEFTKESINEIISFYNKVRSASSDQNKLKKLKKEFVAKQNHFQIIVDNIGEDFIKGILNNHIEFLKEQFLELSN